MPTSRAVRQYFSKAAETLTAGRPVNVNGFLGEVIGQWYLELEANAGLATTLTEVARGRSGETCVFHVHANMLRDPIIVRVSWGELECIEPSFHAALSRVAEAVRTAVAADPSESPAMRAVATVQMGHADEVQTLRRAHQLLARELADLKGRYDRLERKRAREYEEHHLFEQEMRSAQRRWERGQQQCSEDRQWIGKLLQQTGMNVERLQRSMAAMQARMEAVMAGEFAMMAPNAGQACMQRVLAMAYGEEAPGAAAGGPSETEPSGGRDCYVCLEAIEPDHAVAHLCGVPGHAVHARCGRLMLSVEGTDTGDGCHVFPRAVCGVCRQRREGDVCAALPASDAGPLALPAPQPVLPPGPAPFPAGSALAPAPEQPAPAAAVDGPGVDEAIGADVRQRLTQLRRESMQEALLGYPPDERADVCPPTWLVQYPDLLAQHAPEAASAEPAPAVAAPVIAVPPPPPAAPDDAPPPPPPPPPPPSPPAAPADAQPPPPLPPPFDVQADGADGGDGADYVPLPWPSPVPVAPQPAGLRFVTPQVIDEAEVSEVLMLCGDAPREEVLWQFFMYKYAQPGTRMNNACMAMLEGDYSRPTAGWVCSCDTVWLPGEDGCPDVCVGCGTPQPV